MPFILCEPVEPVNVYITLFFLFHFLGETVENSINSLGSRLGVQIFTN
jgi:hypothetical protein